MATANTDRNLLFGILALQMDFISREALVKAMNAWVLEKAKGLGQILVEHKALASERHALLEALVQEHLKQHSNDPEKSLAAVSSVGSVREELKQIADPDLNASLAHVSAAHQAGEDSWATHAPPSVGTPTSAGTRLPRNTLTTAASCTATSSRATSCWASTAKRWSSIGAWRKQEGEAATGKQLGPDLQHQDRVLAVAFSPNGKTVLTGSYDKTARLWRFPPQVRGDPEQVFLWTQVIPGLELDEHGVMRVLDAATWEQRRLRLQELGGPPES